MAAVKKIGRDLTTGSVFKGLMIFVIPIILTNMIQQIYSLVDLMVIGEFVGNAGTVGVSTGGEVSDFLTPVATAFATAGQIYIAQLAGAKEVNQQKKAVGTFISFMMIMSVVLMIGTIALCVPILKLLNCPTEEGAFGQAQSYLIITSVGLPFIFGYNCVCGILRGMGESKRPLVFISIAAVINILLDLLLVVVFPMEAAGTAIATVISQLASFAASLIYMYKCREQIDFSFKLSYFKIDKKSLKIILALGIPQACRSVLVRFSMLWVNANVNAYGIVESSTNSVGNKLLKILEIFSSSMSQAGGAMVGQNLGAKKHSRAVKVVLLAALSCTLVAGIITIVVVFYPHVLFGLFTKDDAVLDMGVAYLNIMIVHFFASAITSSFQCLVIGSGNAPLNFIIGLLDGVVCKIGFSVLFLFLINFDNEVYAYWWGNSVSRILPGIICIVYLISGRWKNYDLMKDKTRVKSNK